MPESIETETDQPFVSWPEVIGTRDRDRVMKDFVELFSHAQAKHGSEAIEEPLHRGDMDTFYKLLGVNALQTETLIGDARATLLPQETTEEV